MIATPNPFCLLLTWLEPYQQRVFVGNVEGVCESQKGVDSYLIFPHRA